MESLRLRGLLTDEQAAAVDQEALERFLRVRRWRRRSGTAKMSGVSILSPFLMDARDYDPDAAGGGSPSCPGRGGLLL